MRRLLKSERMQKHLALALALFGSGCVGEPTLDNAVVDRADELTPYVAGPPVMQYSRARPAETQTYPQLPVLKWLITDPSALAVLTGTTVGCQLDYQPLAQASATATTLVTTCSVGAPPIIGTGRVVSINPNSSSRNLRAIAPYRVRLTILSSAGTGVGGTSVWAYSTTGNTSTSPSTTLQLGRIDMALLAFAQLGDAQAGLIGAGGTLQPDGSRFVSTAHPNYDPGDELHGWCDWFYHYLGVIVTDGLDGNLSTDPVAFGGNTFWHANMNPDNVPNAFRDTKGDGCGTERVADLDHDGTIGVLDHGCQDYTTTDVTLDTDDNEMFSNISTNIYYNFSKSLPMNQAMGNYQAMDQHAGMFLDFDPNGNGTKTGAGTTGTVWSIEGNVNDTVMVMARDPANTTINGYGKLDLAMFQ